MIQLPLEYHDVEQNKEEWKKLRSGRITSSKLGDIMANYGKAFGPPAKKYAIDLAIEQITGKPVESAYSNGHMERGHIQEPLARNLYQAETFSELSNGGFFCNEILGCSPDNLVDDDGLSEIKCVITSVHYANVKRQDVDPSYKWQYHGNLLFTGRKWLDFVSYCSEYPEGKQLYVYRIFADDLSTEFNQIQSRIDEFLNLVSVTKESILNSEYFHQ